MLSNKNKIILLAGHRHNEIIAPETYLQIIEGLTARAKVSFLDEINKETLEDWIIQDMCLSAKTSEEFRYKYEKAIADGVISKDNNFFTNTYKIAIENKLIKSDVCIDNDFKKIKELAEQVMFFKIGLLCDEKSISQYKKACKTKDGFIKLLNSIIEKSDYSNAKHTLLRMCFQEKYINLHNFLIKTLQENPKIKYQFIDHKDVHLIHASDAYTDNAIFNARDVHMANSIIKHIKNNSGQQLIIVNIGAAHVPGITTMLEMEYKGNIKILSINGIKINNIVNPNFSLESLYEDLAPRLEDEQAKDKQRLLDSIEQAKQYIGIIKKYTIPNFTKEKLKQLSETGLYFDVRSQDENNNAEILIESDLLKKNIRELLEIERKKVTLSSAKEQIQALKNLKLVTIETTSDSKLLITYPLSLEKEVEKIVMNFEEYQAQQTTSFVKLTEETKSNSNTSQQI